MPFTRAMDQHIAHYRRHYTILPARNANLKCLKLYAIHPDIALESQSMLTSCLFRQQNPCRHTKRMLPYHTVLHTQTSPRHPQLHDTHRDNIPDHPC
jgi:hypothetical protein